MQVETLARAVLKTPIEIQVGGRSVVNSDITQSVEIRPIEDRSAALLPGPLPYPHVLACSLFWPCTYKI